MPIVERFGRSGSLLTQREEHPGSPTTTVCTNEKRRKSVAACVKIAEKKSKPNVF